MNDWVRSNEIYTYRHLSGLVILFAGDGTDPSHPLHRAPRRWHVMDLKPFGVPADATFAMLSAQLIVTDLTAGIDNLTCTVRPVGSQLDAGNYQMQAMSVFSGDGARGRQGPVNVALTNGCFELFWAATANGQPEDLTPSPSSFLINMTCDGFGRYVPPSLVVPPEGLLLRPAPTNP